MRFSEDVTDEFLKAIKKRKAGIKEEDIGPVRDDADGFFQSGAFNDGYQFGDVTKSILGTVGDVGLGIFRGIGSFSEGLTDLAFYGAAGIAKATGDDAMAEAIRYAASENQLDKMTKKADDHINRYSFLGEKSDAITEGLGQVATTLATGGIGGSLLSTGAMAASGIGSGMSEAYQSGATDKEAVTYGLIAGASDALTEMIFGGLGKGVKAVGISKGLSSADDMLAKAVSGKFKNQIAKNFVEFGIKAGAEGVEEVLSGIAQAVGKKVTYMSEESLGKILKDENLLDQFIVGAITSGIAQSGVVPGMKIGSLIEANKTGRDFVSGLTQSEQTGVDQIYKDTLAETEKNGRLSNRQKNKIYDGIIATLDKGDISAGTIGKSIEGKGYKAYKDTADSKVDRGFENAYRGETNHTAQESGVKYSIQRTQNISWEEQIKGALYGGGEIKRSDTLVAGYTSNFLENKGISQKPLAIPLSVLTKAKSGKDASHSILDSNLEKLQTGIQNAPIIIDNPARNALVFLTDIQQEGKPILVAFKKDANFDGDNVHQATSIHLQMDVASMLAALPAEAKIYAKNSNELNMAVGVANNLRSLAAQVEFVDESIAYPKKSVNNKSSLSPADDIAPARSDMANDADIGPVRSDVGTQAAENHAGQNALNRGEDDSARREQAFQADLSKFRPAERATVQKAMDCGFLNNAANTHQFVALVAKIAADKGISFDFADNAKIKASGFAIQGKTVNGYVTKDGITLNVNSPKVLNSLVGHEITHVLEGTALYDDLQKAVFRYAKSKGEYQSRLETLTQVYNGMDADVQAELTADLVGDYLFTDTGFIMQLSTEHRNLFQRIFDEIKYLCKIATAGTKEARDLEKVKRAFENAYRGETNNTAQESGGVRYALGQYTDVQKENWKKSNKIIVYENDAQLLQFVADSIANKDAANKMYLGVITGDLAKRIKADTGLDFNGKNAVIRAKNVRKILLHDHGNVDSEKLRGQIAITDKDFLAIKNIFGDPDTVKLEPKGYEGKPAATFEKVIGSKKYTMFVVDSGGSLDIFVQTMYAHKQKGSIANVANAKALTSTPKATVGTAPFNSIPKNPGKVNNDIAPIRRDILAGNDDIGPVRSDLVRDDDIAPVRSDLPHSAKDKVGQGTDTGDGYLQKNQLETSENSSTIKMSNVEVRKWYLKHVSQIIDGINQSSSVEVRAKAAFEERNRIRTEARKMMADEETRKLLEKERPNLTFEELVKSKMKRKGMTREEAIQDILKTATKTNESVNSELGLGDK